MNGTNLKFITSTLKSVLPIWSQIKQKRHDSWISVPSGHPG